MNASVQSDLLADLLAAAASGDPSAWEVLLEAMLPIVWQATLTAGLSEDDGAEVCHVVVVRLAQHLHELAADGDVAAWLAREAERECRRATMLAQGRSARVIPLPRPLTRADTPAAARARR